MELGRTMTNYCPNCKGTGADNGYYCSCPYGIARYNHDQDESEQILLGENLKVRKRDDKRRRKD